MKGSIIELDADKLTDRILEIVNSVNVVNTNDKKKYSDGVKMIFQFLKRIGINIEYIGSLDGGENDLIEKVYINGVRFDMEKTHHCGNCGNWRCHDPIGAYYMDTCYNSVGKIYWEPKNESESE